MATVLDEAEVIETKRGTCPICGAGCYVQAKIAGNRAVSIRPDRTAGFPADCPRAGQAVDYHDHPERVNYPMKRVGKRGEGKWERITWDQALDEIAEKLSSIRDRFGPEAVQTMGGSYKGAGDASCWRWSNLWGTPNILYQGKNCGEAELLSEWAVYGDQTCIGNRAIPGTTKCIILWGVGGSMSMASQVKNLKEYRRQGGKVIAIDPRRTDVTEMSDLWLQPRPGTDGALAYGMINVIISEGLHDADFVARWCTGFDELAEAVSGFTPERTSQITWVPADKIVEAARMFATNTPGLIPFGLGTAELGKATTSAVFGKTYLRAITGNLDVEGGARFADPPESTRFREEMHWDTLIDHPLRQRDNISADRWPIASVRGLKAFRKAMEKVHPLGVGPTIYNMVVAPSAIPTAILEGKPYPVKAWILQAGNPLVSLNDARRLHEALTSDELELSVNMDHWMTPCGALADYVLPATDGLERPLLSNMWGFGDAFSASRRIVEPLYERRDDYQLWRELGNRLGQEGMWPDTMEQWFDRILEPSGITHAELADQPVPWIMAEPDYRRYEQRGFATASGKVELASALLAELGYPAIPEYEEPAWSPEGSPELFKDFPLILMTGNSLKWYYRSQHKHLEVMRKQHPYAQFTMHPDTAAELGIEEDSPVWVETPMGKVRQQAKFDAGMHPRVVHADSHMWYPERDAEGDAHFGVWESNINAILPDGEQYTDYAGDNYMRGLICRVTPAEGEVEPLSLHPARIEMSR
ncbi:MAG: molybdopterin-dependent oxidoreductase [Novosphingobium sp.]|nr:molybdopterin-dependent oxidoreductase [Novosphingobium sp.]MCP5404479.1 molybdopterin-dependent oxidoreductase [Novosphingobium sp.]